MTWKNSKLDKVKITSRLGGNCRIRAYDGLKPDASIRLTKAKGNNSNTFFAVAKIKQPLVSDKVKANTPQLKKVYGYDLPTQPGKTYIFRLQ